MSSKNRSGKKRKKLSTKYILFLLTLLCTACIFTSLTVGLSGGPLKTAAGIIFVPMQKGLNAAGNSLVSTFSSLKSMKELQKENAQLKEQVNDLTEDLNLLQMEQYDVDEYRELLELSEKYSELSQTGASVISKDTGSWFTTFMIDKGTSDGVEKGMNVLSQSGLVGIVTDAASNYATVRTIIDDTSNISAMDATTKDTMNISGSLQEMNTTKSIPFTQLLDEDDEVQVGDPVETSYISDEYHEGILIGYIATLTTDPNNLTKSGTITPVVDFEHLQNVIVITEQKTKPQETDTEEE